MAEIVFDNVWKEYGDKVVLERIDLKLHDREFLAVVGPSGMGKTTLLRMLLSQERPTRGRILIDGAPIAGEPTDDRGVVFQRYSVFPHRTVLNNVMLGPSWRSSRLLGRVFGEKRAGLRKDAIALLERVGLRAAADLYPQQLSGGMQQRLALAQAIIMKPKVLLLDEPFGALDPGTRGSMQALVRELWEEQAMTVVMVTHDIPEAFSLGTRVIALDKRHDPDAPERFGASVCSDFAVKLRIVRESREFEAARARARSMQPPTPPVSNGPLAVQGALH